MIAVEYYTIIYYIFLSITLMFILVPMYEYNNSLRVTPGFLYGSSWALLIYVICFIGLRDPYGDWRFLGDTSVYSRMFEQIKMISFTEEKDIGFSLFMKLCAPYMNIEMFYVLCAALYVLPVYSAFKRWFKHNAFFALAMYISSMSFFGFGINGLRNGLAASFFIYSLKFGHNKPLAFLFMIVAASFHKSMLLPIAAFIISPYVKDSRFLIRVWFAAIIISFLFGDVIQSGFQLILELAGLEDNRGQMLFSDELDGIQTQRSFRMDFILYSSVGVISGYYFLFKKKYDDLIYKSLFNTYLIANSVWVLLIYAPYTNRTAYLSWLLMPVIMIYPLLKINMVEKQYRFISTFILGSLIFTLIMNLK